MATEMAAPASNRPRPVLLVLLFLAIAGFAISRMFSGGPAPAAVPSTPAQRPGPAGAARNSRVEPTDLDVRIESLSQKSAPPEESSRNIFVFQPKAPPEPPPTAFKPPSKPAEFAPPVNPGPPPPPPIPAIGDTVKFIGVVETARGKIGAFSIWDNQARECRGVPMPGKEGDVLEGKYRIVRIQIESAVLEYLDGKGRATLPLNGQACVVK